MLAALALFLVAPDVEPLAKAHAHNDYAHARPLEDALSYGFCSVEADVYLVDGELRVGHDRKDLVPGRTLEKLYLDPLLARVVANHGHVYKMPAPVTLLVDIKEDGEAVYAELKKRLPKYRQMLTDYRRYVPEASQRHVRQGAVTVVLSGDRPIQTVEAESERLAFLDGRLREPGFGVKGGASVVPLVSDNFGLIFKWRGEGEMPAEERTRLDDAVKQVHATGARLRFWGTPDRPSVWKALDEAGVDLINTDDLSGLATFLRARSRP